MSAPSTPSGPAPARRRPAPAPFKPHARDDGSLALGPRLVVPAGDVDVRVTTSGGPGGQHANRSLTRVVVSVAVETATTLSDAQRATLLDHFGPVVRSGAGRFRSQGANRAAALDQLARRLGDALAPRAPRRPTRPTRASQERRLDDKRARSRVKDQRRRRDDD